MFRRSLGIFLRGSAPMSRLLAAEQRPGRSVVGVDRSAGELARARATAPSGFLVRAGATALPIATASVDAVVVSMALMVLAPVEAVLAEAARVLRAGGAFAATVPSRSRGDGVVAEAPVFAEILDALGQDGTAYPEPLDTCVLSDRFSASGLALHQDETCVFVRTVSGPDDAELVVRSFYAPGAAASTVDAAVAGFQHRVGSAPLRVGYRIRRLTAVR